MSVRLGIEHSPVNRSAPAIATGRCERMRGKSCSFHISGPGCQQRGLLPCQIVCGIHPRTVGQRPDSLGKSTLLERGHHQEQDRKHCRHCKPANPERLADNGRNRNPPWRKIEGSWIRSGRHRLVNSISRPGRAGCTLGETPMAHLKKRQPEPRLARSTLKRAIALPFSAKQAGSAPAQDFVVVNGQLAARQRNAGGLPLIRSQAHREPARNNPPSTAGSGRRPRNSRARCCPPGSPLLRFPSGSIARSFPFLPARSPVRSP